MEIGKQMYLPIGVTDNGNYHTTKYPTGIAMRCTDRTVWDNVKFFSMNKLMKKHHGA